MTELLTLGGIGWLFLAHCLYPLGRSTGLPSFFRKAGSTLATSIGFIILLAAYCNSSLNKPGSAWILVAGMLTWVVIDVLMYAFRLWNKLLKGGVQ